MPTLDERLAAFEKPRTTRVPVASLDERLAAFEGRGSPLTPPIPPKPAAPGPSLDDRLAAFERPRAQPVPPSVPQVVTQPQLPSPAPITRRRLGKPDVPKLSDEQLGQLAAYVDTVEPKPPQPVAPTDWSGTDWSGVAQIVSRTPPLGLAEHALAFQALPAERDRLLGALREQYAKDQAMRKAGYGARVATSLVQGAIDFGLPLAKWTGAIPSLDPDQEKFKQQLIGLRETVDPTIRPETPLIGKWAQQAARMTMPMVQSIGAARAAGQAALLAGGGKRAAAIATGTGASASFLPQIADQTYSELITEGIDPSIAKWTTVVSAPVEAAIESILPDPFKGAGSAFKGTARQLARKVIWEWTKRYGQELSEEALQGASREVAAQVARHLDGTVPQKGIGSVFSEAWEATKEAAGPLLLMLAPSAVTLGAEGYGAAQARAKRLGQRVTTIPGEPVHAEQEPEAAQPDAGRGAPVGPQVGEEKRREAATPEGGLGIPSGGSDVGQVPVEVQVEREPGPAGQMWQMPKLDLPEGLSLKGALAAAEYMFGGRFSPRDPQGKTEEEIADFLSSRGKRFSFVVTDRRQEFGGLYVGHIGGVILLRDFEKADDLWFIVGHEVAHESGIDLILPADEPTLVAAKQRHLQQETESYRSRLESDSDLLDQEARADVVGLFLRDPAFRDKLQRDNPSLWERLREFILRVVGKWTPQNEAHRLVLNTLREQKVSQRRRDEWVGEPAVQPPVTPAPEPQAPPVEEKPPEPPPSAEPPAPPVEPPSEPTPAPSAVFSWEEHEGLVQRIAKKYEEWGAKLNCELDDLKQEARMALARVGKTYDPSRGTAAGYAAKVIDNAITEFLGKAEDAVRHAGGRAVQMPEGIGEPVSREAPPGAGIEAAEEIEEARRKLGEGKHRKPKRKLGQRPPVEEATPATKEPAPAAEEPVAEVVEPGLPDVTMAVRADPYYAKHSDIERTLRREQEKGKPAWSFGDEVYTTSGKYKFARDATTGRVELYKLHFTDLTASGLMRHFKPNEYHSYNRAAKELHDKLQAKKLAEDKARQEEDAKERKQEAKERAAKAERDRIDAAARQIVAQGAKAMKGKQGPIEVRVGDDIKRTTITATIYGDLAVYRSNLDEPKKGPWTVTHVNTGYAISLSFKYSSKRQAAEAAWLLQQGMDWSFADENKVPSGYSGESRRRLAWFMVPEGGADIPDFLKEQMGPAAEPSVTEEPPVEPEPKRKPSEPPSAVEEPRAEAPPLAPANRDSLKQLIPTLEKQVAKETSANRKLQVAVSLMSGEALDVQRGLADRLREIAPEAVQYFEASPSKRVPIGLREAFSPRPPPAVSPAEPAAAEVEAAAEPPLEAEPLTPAAQARAKLGEAVKDLNKYLSGRAYSGLDPELARHAVIIVGRAIKAGFLTFAEFLQSIRAEHGPAIAARLAPILRGEWERQRGLVRPELAIHATTPESRTTASDVDKIRAMEGRPEVISDEAVEAEASIRYEASPEAETENLIAKGTAGGQLDAVETAIARKINTETGDAAIASGNAAEIARAIAVNEAYRNTGHVQAVAFRQRRDRMESPEERMARAIREAILEPPRAQREARNAARREGRHGEADRINAEWAERMAELKAKLKQLGVDIDALSTTGYTPRKAAEVLRAIASAKADKWDKAYEYWLNAILSAPTTQAANILGNVGHAIWALTAERMTEALANTLLERPEAAQLGEFKYLLAGVLPGISRGARNFLKSWATETPALEAEIHRSGVTKVEERRSAIGGRLGRVVRAPVRLLGAVDDFCKSVIVEMEVGARAYRMAKAEGLSEDGMQRRIAELTADTESPAWDATYDSALELAFQQKGGKTIQSLKRNVLAFRRDVPGTRYLLPFVTTPLNIFGTGVRKTPLGTLALAKRMYENYRNERSMLEGMPKYVAEQVIAWAVIALLLGSDPEDPWITGGQQVWGSKREVAYRTFPPNSIKIGGEWYSYSRLEPFATVLGLAVDWVGALRSGVAKQVASVPVESFVNQVGSKTFLSGIGSLVEAVDSESPAESLAKWASNFAVSWVPNVAKALSREAADEYMNRRFWGNGSEWTSRLLKRTLQRTELTAIQDYPLYDVWGRPATRTDSPVGADWLWRIMVPIRAQKATIFVADRALLNWNNQHPDDQAFFPTIPLPYYTKDGKRHSMSDQEYAEICRQSGEMATKQLEGWAPKNIDAPTRAEIDQITETVADARTIVREMMFSAPGVSAIKNPWSDPEGLPKETRKVMLKWAVGRGDSVILSKGMPEQKKRGEKPKLTEGEALKHQQAEVREWEAQEDESDEAYAERLAAWEARRDTDETWLKAHKDSPIVQEAIRRVKESKAYIEAKTPFRWRPGRPLNKDSQKRHNVIRDRALQW